VLIGLEGPAEWSRDEGHKLWSIGNILQRALIDKLRLELGGIYYVQVDAHVQKVPYNHYVVDFLIPCAPENVEKLVAATYAEIARMRKDGLRPEEIQKEIEAQRRSAEKEQQDNKSWTWKLEMIYRDGESFTRLSDPNEMISLVTAENMQRTAVKYLDTTKAIRFTMLPEKK
jgi:zinc protease